MKKQGLEIFDLDGTLIDTSLANYCSYCDAAKKVGFELEFSYNEYLEKYNGKTYKEFLKNINLDEAKKIHIEKSNIYMNYFDKCKINEELFNHIQEIRDTKYVVLATNASRNNVNNLLNYFGKYEFFDLILTREDVENIKPNPEIFNKAMEYFNISATDTVVYEDSKDGLDAAEKAGVEICVINMHKEGK